MATLKLGEIKTILNPIGVYVSERDAIYTGVSIDSRTVREKEIFVAIKGKRFDGHDFVDEAFKRGASLAIVERRVEYPSLVVKDTLLAMKQLAAYNLKKSGAYSIAVTGSSGKTTTKDLISLMLDNSHKTFKNENNEIGVAKTLLGIENHDVCVVEVGTNHSGEIPEIVRFFKPDMAVFTNIGTSHIGNFGSIENILKEKVSLAERTTTVVYNEDDELLRKHFHPRGIGCSIGNKNAGSFIEEETADTYTLNILNRRVIIGKRTDIHPMSILLSVTAAMIYKPEIEEERIKQAIDGFRLPPLRWERVKIGKTLFILDCYNANPDSMAYAIEKLASMKGRKLAVLGDMLELGDFSEEMHESIGRLLDKYSIRLIAYGDHARHICNGTNSGCIFLNNKTEVVEFLKERYRNFDAVLIKGSRAMKMEEIFQALKESEV